MLDPKQTIGLKVVDRQSIESRLSGQVNEFTPPGSCAKLPVSRIPDRGSSWWCVRKEQAALCVAHCRLLRGAGAVQGDRAAAGAAEGARSLPSPGGGGSFARSASGVGRPLNTGSVQRGETVTPPRSAFRFAACEPILALQGRMGTARVATIGTAGDDGILPVFCPTEQVVSVRPKFLNPFNPTSTVHGVVFHFFRLGKRRRAYPAPARFFCQTRCTAQVQPGGCEARSFDVSSFAGVATKALSVCCDGM